jgi:thiamine biosynthesis protein ThiS
MKIKVNGKIEELAASVTLSDYLKIKGYDTKLVVIEWNFNTYPREEWHQIFLADDDNLEIIKIVGGG